MKKIYFPIWLILAWPILSQAQPTWSDDIACIIYSHCSGCHTSNGIAPFNLMDYPEAYANRYAIQSSVNDKSMPPWPPNQDFRELAHANVLTDDEITLINQWVDFGAPEGDPMNAPEPPVFDNVSEITDEDMILELPEYTVPPISSDLYKCFVIQTDLGEDKSITGIEIIPGNRNIVHHVLVYQDLSNSAVNQDNNDPSEGFTCFGTPGSSSAELIAGWAPGSRARILPAGMGIPLPNGTNIVVQIHYPNGSTGEVDATKIKLKFADGNNLRTVYNQPILNFIENINEPLVIPANTVKSFHAEFEIPIDVTGINIAPHAHLICTSMRCEAELPSGEIVPLIDIPEWDFNWQGFYDFKSPVILPANTKLHGYATYDNTSNNPNNPNNPPQMVTAGEATTDEMMVFYVSFLLKLPGDENIVIDADDHAGHHDDCTPTNSVGIADLDIRMEMEIFPNPVNGSNIRIELPQISGNDSMIEVSDATGKKIATIRPSGMTTILDVEEQGWTTGIYFFRIVENGTQLTRTHKIVIMD